MNGFSQMTFPNTPDTLSARKYMGVMKKNTMLTELNIYCTSRAYTVSAENRRVYQVVNRAISSSMAGSNSSGTQSRGYPVTAIMINMTA